MPWGLTMSVSKDELHDELIDREDIPLDFDYVSESLARCAAFARQVSM